MMTSSPDVILSMRSMTRRTVWPSISVSISFSKPVTSNESRVLSSSRKSITRRQRRSASTPRKAGRCCRLRSSLTTVLTCSRTRLLRPVSSSCNKADWVLVSCQKYSSTLCTRLPCNIGLMPSAGVARLSAPRRLLAKARKGHGAWCLRIELPPFAVLPLSLPGINRG